MNTVNADTSDLFDHPDDDFLEFMSFPDVNYPTSPNSGDDAKKNDFINPLQNAVPKTVTEQEGKTYATLNNVVPVILHPTDLLNAGQQSPVLTDDVIVINDAPISTNYAGAPQPTSPVLTDDVIVINDAPISTNYAGAPQPTSPVLTDDVIVINGAPISTNYAGAPQPTSRPILSTDRSLHLRRNTTLAVGSRLQSAQNFTSKVSIPKHSALSTTAQVIFSPSSQNTGPAATESKPPRFLWQRSEKFDDPKKEKSRLDAIKARSNRLKDKQRNDELQIKLSDVIKERDELQKTVEKNAGEKKKILSLLKHRCQENKVLRHHLSQALQGNLQVMIKEVEREGSKHIVSELVQMPSSLSDNVAGSQQLGQTNLQAPVNNGEFQVLSSINCTNNMSLPSQISQQAPTSISDGASQKMPARITVYTGSLRPDQIAQKVVTSESTRDSSNNVVQTLATQSGNPVKIITSADAHKAPLQALTTSNMIINPGLLLAQNPMQGHGEYIIISPQLLQMKQAATQPPNADV